MVALPILPAPQLLQTPYPPQPQAPQFPPGRRCSWWRCRFFRPRSSCRLRILLSPRHRRSLREVAVHGGAADSSGAASLVDSASSSAPGPADSVAAALFMVALPILPAPQLLCPSLSVWGADPGTSASSANPFAPADSSGAARSFGRCRLRSFRRP